MYSTQFKWDDVDLNNDDQLKELYQLLNENYVEDDDNMFRFDYAPEFLKWALMPPGWLACWHVGVRVEKNNKLGEHPSEDLFMRSPFIYQWPSPDTVSIRTKLNETISVTSWIHIGRPCTYPRLRQVCENV